VRREDELEALRALLASCEDRLRAGDRNAEPAVVALSRMIVERERELADGDGERAAEVQLNG
jgi:hypothetical protein